VDSGCFADIMPFDLARFASTLRAITEIESPSFDKAAVDRCGVRIRELFQELGASSTVVEQPKFGNHLRFDFPGLKRGKPIMLLGHFDTVWNLGTVAKMPIKTEKGRIWGPGVYDMKGGIVIMLETIRSLKEKHGELPRPITVWLVTDEEVGSESSRPMTEALAKESEAVLVLEPCRLDGAIKTARKGVGDYTVRVTGVSSHAGVDFQKGQSAVLELAKQIQKIATFTDLKRGTTVNPGVVRGGTRTNVVADLAEVECDIRVTKMKDAATLDKKFRALKPFNRKCRVEVEGGMNRPPMERSPAVAKLFKIGQGVAKDLGFKLKEHATGGGSDGNFTAGLGIPTLDGLGAVGDGAHAVHESILVDELPRRVALIAGLIERM
jgi:glutamate carboxypeptidase